MMHDRQKSHDPVTLGIIQSALQATSDEMFLVMRKASMSAIIYEVLDMGTGITDAKGEISSSGAGIPGFVGVLDKAVKALLGRFDHEDIHPGDVFAINDPFHGGVTHLNDMIFAMPVFADGGLIAWTANIAHWNDLGGMVPGGMSLASHEIFQEGLRVPGVRVISKGETLHDMFAIFETNSRMPDYLRGDMWAAISAVRKGAARIEQLAAKYGAGTVVAAMASFMDYGEAMARDAIAALPKGKFSISEPQDDGLEFSVTVEITDSAVIVDLRDNPDQVASSKNASRDGAMVAAQMAYMALMKGVPANAGTYRPLELRTRPGSVFHAVAPAATAFYVEIEVRLLDLILRCLAEHMRDLIPAGGFSSICGTLISGIHPETGRHYSIVEPELGGWGAAEGADGPAALFSPFHGETYNCPVEVAELRYGVDVEQLAYSDAPGGEGRWCGGKGIVMDYRIRGRDSVISVGYTRAKIPPWGVAGGSDGSHNYIEIHSGDAPPRRESFASSIPLAPGDLVRIHTAVGAGYGPVEDRDREAIRSDLKNGLITPARAKAVFGFDTE